MSEYLDTSIIVKWFKEEDETYRNEALKLRDRIINFESEFVMSYYGLLELIRAMVKHNYPKESIEEAFQSINDLYEIDGLKNVRMEDVLFLVKEIEIELGLYASDALHLASAINHSCKIFWSEDQHHLKNKTKNYMQKFGVEIKSLKEIDLKKNNN